jgi:hypothetical protein
MQRTDSGNESGNRKGTDFLRNGHFLNGCLVSGISLNAPGVSELLQEIDQEIAKSPDFLRNATIS